MIFITLCFKVNTKTILLVFALHFANVYPYFRGWWEVKSGSLVLNSGDKWEVGLTKYVGSGFGGRWTIKHGGRWKIGPQNSWVMGGWDHCHTPPTFYTGIWRVTSSFHPYFLIVLRNHIKSYPDNFHKFSLLRALSFNYCLSHA